LKLRIRDNLLYGGHWLLAQAGAIRPPTLEQIRMEGFHRVLVVATTALGDAVLCTPLIRSLRKANPQAKIGFLTSRLALPLFKPLRELDVVIPYYGKYRQVRKTLRQLREWKFDLALVANANDPDVIPLIWWSGCRRIVRRPQRHTIYSFMIANPDMLSRSHTEGHAIERNLQFCDLLGMERQAAVTHLDLNPEAARYAENVVNGYPQPRVIIHPGASRSRKQWGAENYVELCRKILSKMEQGSLILTGSPPEAGMCSEIKAGLGHAAGRILNLAGHLDLGQLAALFKKASLLISGDTGPYHIAMAVGTPTVTLFAPWDVGSSSKINGPFFNLHQHRVIETEMGKPIISIRVDEVYAAVLPFLAEVRNSPMVKTERL
jgi:ADP-heptose:LPS heptosyltransferase